jgi:hypothetical protein
MMKDDVTPMPEFCPLRASHLLGDAGVSVAIFAAGQWGGR